MTGAGDQVCIFEPVADLGRVCGGNVRGPVMTGGKLLLRDRQQKITLLDAVMLPAVQQSLGTTKPSRRAAPISSK
jgi:hypothetical protein